MLIPILFKKMEIYLPKNTDPPDPDRQVLDAKSDPYPANNAVPTRSGSGFGSTTLDKVLQSV